MDGPGFEAAAPLDPEPEAFAETEAGWETQDTNTGDEDISLEAIAAELERDPGECWRAFQGLKSIGLESRLSVIEGLAELSPGPGVRGLLELLASEGDIPTRRAALKAIEDVRHADSDVLAIAPDSLARPASCGNAVPARTVDGSEGSSAILARERGSRLHLVDSLVTAVDGEGRAAIGFSASQGGHRTTALFLCDVERGVLNADGQIEDESDQSGELLCEFRTQAAGLWIAGTGELALGLLAGELMLNGPLVPEPVNYWLEATFEGQIRPQAFPVPGAGAGSKLLGGQEMARRALEILGACPTWLDRSALTFDFAEEIVLREGRTDADPRRDSGAFRYLFEHRFNHRLEHYRRLLLWMSRFWHWSGEADLAWSALTFAEQLSDEQYAVPAHPFTVALTTLSLNRAQTELGTRSDPRAGHATS